MTSIIAKRFLDDLDNTISMSDKLGLVYWVAVLTTISCGFATGIYVTLTNKSAMVKSCQQKYELYEDFLLSKQIQFDQVPWIFGENETVFSRQTLKGRDEIDDLVLRIEFFDQKLR